MIFDPDPSEIVGRAAVARVAELQQTLQRFRREHRAALGALPPVSEDPVAHALAAPSRRLLAQVEAALERLEKGTYARCVSCQRRIPAKRLAAEPYVAQCIACAVHSATQVRRS
jgi:RNA polymerase-binding transcription factor DksA